jgi:hypothetical protein
MASSQVLEVSVGLMFIYLLLSAVCSGTKELMARALDMRANTLEKAIRNMLADPGGSITSKLIQNHLIAGMVEPGTKPSYISSRNFALALFDVIAPTNACQSKLFRTSKTDGSALLFDLLNKIVNLRLTGSPPPDFRQPVSNQRLERKSTASESVLTKNKSTMSDAF